MDRRYYGIKALILALGLAIVGLMGMPASHNANSMTQLHYGAATEVEMAVLHTSAKISHAVMALLQQLES